MIFSRLQGTATDAYESDLDIIFVFVFNIMGDKLLHNFGAKFQR